MFCNLFRNYCVLWPVPKLSVVLHVLLSIVTSRSQCLLDILFAFILLTADMCVVATRSVRVMSCLRWTSRNDGVWGIGGIAPCSLKLGTRWRGVVSYMAQPLYSQLTYLRNTKISHRTPFKVSSFQVQHFSVILLFTESSARTLSKLISPPKLSSHLLSWRHACRPVLNSLSISQL